MTRYARLLGTGMLSLLFAACSTGGGGGDGDPDPPIADISGTWSITETMGSNTCGEVPGSQNTYSITVTVSGNSVTVVTPAGTFTGTIDGDQLEWTGSYPDDGGTTTINSMDLTVSANGSSVSGTTSWSWTDGTESCSGTTTVNGTRTSGGGGGGGSTESEPNDSTGQADPITSSITGTVNVNTDTDDYFVFTAGASGGIYNLSLTWTNIATDVDLVVYNPTDPNPIAVSDDVNTTSESISNLILGGSDTIYIRVSTLFDGSGNTESYTLTISQ